MTSMTTIPVEDWFTADDLDTLPDDGNRYELLDGELLVTPSPRVRHQVVSLALGMLLHGGLPEGLRVLTAPMDVRFGPRRQLQPDLLVVHDEGLDGVRVESVPLLVVEILSPGTRARDQVTKRRAYEQEGVGCYWLVDPGRPSLTALELHQGAYQQVGHVEGGQAWTSTRPYPLTVVPADLLR